MNEGNIVLNFDDENIRNEAAQKYENVDEVSKKRMRKLRSKIRDKIIESWLNRILFLCSIPAAEGKIEMNFNECAASGTVHCVLKCNPVVRELIHKHHDII